MRTLAVTGGIGSGKSYVVRMFAALGIPVYDADSRTKRLYDEDRGLLGALQAILGPGLVKDGRLDRQYMAGRIFSDRCLLEKVEALVFPEVVADFDRQLDSERRNPVGNDFFWVQIQQGQRRDPAGHPGKKPFLDFFSSRRRRQEVALEKRLMREQIQWLRQLFERRIYDEKAGEILSRIVNSRKEHADSFATSYIDLELLYDRFLGNLTLIRMQAVLAAAVLTMRETGRMPADMSSLSKAGTIPALATFHPLDGKPFQIFQEEIELPDNETGMAIVIQGTGGEAAPRREMRTFCVTK